MRAAGFTIPTDYVFDGNKRKPYHLMINPILRACTPPANSKAVCVARLGRALLIVANGNGCMRFAAATLCWRSETSGDQAGPARGL